MGKPKAPCKDCPEKGCGMKHSTCEAYIEYQKKQEKWREDNRLTEADLHTIRNSRHCKTVMIKAGRYKDIRKH